MLTGHCSGYSKTINNRTRGANNEYRGGPGGPGGGFGGPGGGFVIVAVVAKPPLLPMQKQKKDNQNPRWEDLKKTYVLGFRSFSYVFLGFPI